MSLVLYRKYRPRLFSEVIGQDHIISALKGGIKHDKTAHAYLFAGPRGTGKTTVARILAKTLNCLNQKDGESCEKCVSCKTIAANEAMDIMEIDAASNRGIDEIRALRDGVRFSPTLLKYKVFIIDEVHMLTKESFNALLKTLEEPPSHAIFILATTEIHKVLPTIISRCQRFDFRRIDIDRSIKRLAAIAKSEKVKISNDALKFIGVASGGCMRDAESLLGQIIALGDKDIDLKDAQNILGVADMKVVFDFFDNIFTGKNREAFLIINELAESGRDIQYFLRDAICHTRKLVLIKANGVIFGDGGSFEGNGDFLKSVYEWTEDQKKRAVLQVQKIREENLLGIFNVFIKAADDLRKFPLPQMALEIAVLEVAKELGTNFLAETGNDELDKKSFEKRLSEEPGELTATEKGAEKEVKKNEKTGNEEDAGKISKRKSDIGKEKDVEGVNGFSIGNIKSNWNDVLKEMKPYNHSISAFLGASLPQELNGDVLTIATKYNFHKERLEERKNKILIEEVLEKVFGKKIVVKCVLNQDLNFTQKAGEKAKDLVSSALKIFGGKIVK